MTQTPAIPLLMRTYTAQPFFAESSCGAFQMSGTIEGLIDLAVPQGNTYQLSIVEARILAAALLSAASDVELNCLKDKDPILAYRPEVQP